MDEKQVKELLQENDYLTTQNANYRSYCQDLADFFLPRKSWITSIKTQGDRVKFNFLYDSTAILAARTAAQGIHSNLTNETMRWYGLESLNENDMKSRSVRQWFKELEDKSLAAFRNSNFYNVKLEDNLDKLIFGTGTYSILEDPKEKIKFKQVPVGQVNRVIDDYGRLKEIYINFEYPARTAYRIFGENVGKSVIECLVNKPFQMFEFVHCVKERYERDVAKEDSTNMPYESVWINKKDRHLIAESGFMEMPYISDVFYSDANDPNGFSPAMDVLPWVKLLNAMARTVIRASMKQADPPLVMPSKGFILPLNFNPVGINYRDSKTNKDDIQALPTGTGKTNLSVEMMQMVAERIKEGMFVPLFQTLNDVTKQLSVLETRQLISQNMAILGPVIGRFDYGTLSPTITRVINILARRGELPPPPEELSSDNYKVVYLGPLAKAQKQAEIAEVQAWMGEIGQVSALIPSILDNVEEDKLANYLHRARSLTPDILREQDAIKQRRDQRAEQDQMVAALQAGGAAAQIAKTGAEAQAATEKKK